MVFVEEDEEVSHQEHLFSETDRYFLSGFKGQLVDVEHLEPGVDKEGKKHAACHLNQPDGRLDFAMNVNGGRQNPQRNRQYAAASRPCHWSDDTSYPSVDNELRHQASNDRWKPVLNKLSGDPHLKFLLFRRCSCVISFPSSQLSTNLPG